MPDRCLTPRKAARYFGVSIDRLRGWIKRGELRATRISDTTMGKQRVVISPAAIAEFEAARATSPPKATQRLPKLPDFFPDLA